MVSPVPEAVVRGLVTEDLGDLSGYGWGMEWRNQYEHETDDDRQAGDLSSVSISDVFQRIGVLCRGFDAQC